MPPGPFAADIATAVTKVNQMLAFFSLEKPIHIYSHIRTDSHI